MSSKTSSFSRPKESDPSTEVPIAAPAAIEDDNLTVFVQNLLGQMQGRFQEMSDTIISRIDDMGGRIDELERSIGDLMTQAGVPEERESINDDSRSNKKL